MKNRIKKIEEVIEVIYIKELLGLTIYENLDSYTELNIEVQELRQLALNYEQSVLSKQTYDNTQLIDKINSIHGICMTIEEYRPSRLLFNEGIMNIDIL